MSCFHRRIAAPAVRSLGAGRSIVGDERGAAALEAIIVVSLLAGVFLACLLIGQWGTSLQSAQLGARLLAFDAGDIELARLGRPANQPVQESANVRWDTLPNMNDTLADWLGGMFALSNDRFSGSVTGTARGRLPGQSSSLFNYGPATLGYHAQDWTAGSNSWTMSESGVQSTFLNIAYYVGRYRTNPNDLDSTNAEEIPPTIAVLETIFGRAGVR